MKVGRLSFRRTAHFKIIVHIDQMPQEDPSALVAEAIHNYFEYKSGRAKRNLSQLLLEGRVSLMIGLSFLAICLLVADNSPLLVLVDNTFLRLLKESSAHWWLGCHVATNADFYV